MSDNIKLNFDTVLWTEVGLNYSGVADWVITNLEVTWNDINIILWAHSVNLTDKYVIQLNKVSELIDIERLKTQKYLHKSIESEEYLASINSFLTLENTILRPDIFLNIIKFKLKIFLITYFKWNTVLNENINIDEVFETMNEQFSHINFMCKRNVDNINLCFNILSWQDQTNNVKDALMLSKEALSAFNEIQINLNHLMNSYNKILESKKEIKKLYTKKSRN